MNAASGLVRSSKVASAILCATYPKTKNITTPSNADTNNIAIVLPAGELAFFIEEGIFVELSLDSQLARSVMLFWSEPDNGSVHRARTANVASKSARKPGFACNDRFETAS